MKSNQIQEIGLKLDEVSASATRLIRVMFPDLERRDFSFEEIVDGGVLMSYFAWGETNTVLIPWVAFDKGTDFWQALLDEEKRLKEEEARLHQEESDRLHKERRYDLYLSLKKEFENENSDHQTNS